MPGCQIGAAVIESKACLRPRLGGPLVFARVDRHDARPKNLASAFTSHAVSSVSMQRFQIRQRLRDQFHGYSIAWIFAVLISGCSGLLGIGDLSSGSGTLVGGGAAGYAASGGQSGTASQGGVATSESGGTISATGGLGATGGAGETQALGGATSSAAATNTDEIIEYNTSIGWYQNDNNGMTFDWAPNDLKGECVRRDFQLGSGAFTTGALGGLSGDYYRRMMVHGINCTDVDPTYFDAQSFSVSLPVWTFPNAYLPITTSYPQGWDWDPSYQEVTCDLNQWVSGVAQPSDASGIDKVQCAGSAANFVRDDDNCFVTTIGVDYNGVNHGSDGGGEWDNGFQKGYCGGEAIAGISRNDPESDPNFGGGIHALLCCPHLDTAHSP